MIDKTRLSVLTDKYPLVVLVVLASLILLPGNNVIIPDIMESRNLITAREMVSDGNWILPTMNGNLRLEKPPLPTWIATWTQMLVGEGWSWMRLVPSLMGIMLLVYFYKFCHMVEERVALPSALILLTCYNFVLASKTVSWDIYCHAFQMAGIYYLYRLLKGTGGRWQNAVLAGLMTGLSILSKGPVSPFALLLPWIFTFIAMERIKADKASSLGGKIAIMAVIALVVGGVWYAYVGMEAESAGMATLDKESSSWLNRNVRPWYYYWSFFTETAIWIPLCLAALLLPCFRKYRVTGVLKKPYMLALIWTLATLVLLSLLPEKKNRYLLPILLPASMMMGTFLEHQVIQGRKWLNKVLGSVVALFILFAWVGMPLLRGTLCNSFYTAPAPVMSRNMEGDIDIRKQYPDLPAFWAQGEELRIELVYDMDRKVKEVNLLDEAAVKQIPRPSLILVCSTLSQDSLQLDKLGNLQKLGTFDANRHAKDTRLYRPKFIYDLFLLQ